MRAWAADVSAGNFPGQSESVRMDDAVLSEALGQGALDRPGAESGSAGATGTRSDVLGGIPLDRDL